MTTVGNSNVIGYVPSKLPWYHTIVSPEDLAAAQVELLTRLSGRSDFRVLPQEQVKDNILLLEERFGIIPILFVGQCPRQLLRELWKLICLSSHIACKTTSRSFVPEGNPDCDDSSNEAEWFNWQPRSGVCSTSRGSRESGLETNNFMAGLGTLMLALSAPKLLMVQGIKQWAIPGIEGLACLEVGQTLPDNRYRLVLQIAGDSFAESPKFVITDGLKNHKAFVNWSGQVPVASPSILRPVASAPVQSRAYGSQLANMPRFKA